MWALRPDPPENRKVNIVARMEIELAYYDVTVVRRLEKASINLINRSMSVIFNLSYRKKVICWKNLKNDSFSDVKKNERLEIRGITDHLLLCKHFNCSWTQHNLKNRRRLTKVIYYSLVSLFYGISTFVSYLIPKTFCGRIVVILFNPKSESEYCSANGDWTCILRCHCWIR